jgi:hypothetical protein
VIDKLEKLLVGFSDNEGILFEDPSFLRELKDRMAA